MGGVDFSNLFVLLGTGTFASLQAAKDAGAATLNYGIFINAIINFLIVAFCLFMVVKGMNNMKKAEAAAPQPAPAEPPIEVKLLSEIRDLLKR